jgi:hypothetical protein
MSASENLKLFALTSSLIHADLERVESVYGVDLGIANEDEAAATDAYYMQFEIAIRAEAASMAAHYELFYCLENSIRAVVSSQLLESQGEDWWDKAVPPAVQDNVKKNIQREQDAGITIRSTEPIDYTTFGELGEIIQSNWETFGDMFNSRKGVTKVISGLNLLRGPIAHCSPLAEDEVVRLELAIRDWFRLME